MKGPIDFEVIPDDAADQCVPSERQRLRIHVPYLKTTLTMGEKADDEKIRDEDAGDMNFPGFGVTTKGHAFLDANGEPPDSMMRLQSKGHLTVQTPSKLALGGKEGSILASEIGTIVAGGGGVSIFGGSGLQWSENQHNDATTPDSPTWISKLQSSTDAWSSFWTVMDTAIAVFGGYQNAVSKEIASLDMHANTAAALASLAGISGAISNSFGLASLASEVQISGGTTIHGSRGLVMGSSMTAGLYSLAGTTIASPAAVSVQGSLVDVFGQLVTSITSKKLTSIQSAKSTAVIGGESTLVTTRKGATTIGGKSVNIGATAELGDAKQAATETVSVSATKAVAVAAEDVLLSGTGAVTVAGGAVHIASEGSCWVNAGKGLLWLDSGEATIGLCDEGPDLAASQKYHDEIIEHYQSYVDALKVVAAKKSEYEKSGDVISKAALTLAQKHADSIQKTIDDLKSVISALQHKKNAITFKSDGIEIVFEGTKMKLDGSKVESGPIKWKTS